ncbi:hypothetical protein CPB84DRAFT_1735717 [Gymnopilus junonius]|uniref:NAD-dependent epimerase/dehydratase domain-containing protein n=1 Tax=Gymnopilus junonius TaxID=109634 RepID=A0A9P5NDY3_GYMJU|nr:hypothetical protein CPB84DRAFT_1735717 [Gymnopilus junonius]
MIIAVTGSNGSIGRRVVKLALERGHHVVGIDLTEPQYQDGTWLNRPEYTFKQGDLTDFGTTLNVLAGSDAVIALAAYPTPGDYRVQSHNNNVVVSWNILRACADLSINRIAQASSINVITMWWSQSPRLHYFPIDEEHPCEPDGPYGLSKVIMELQADTIIRRYQSMKIASLRPSWSLPGRAVPGGHSTNRAKDLWSYTQEDSGAEAFILAVEDNDKWAGHERFFIVAPHTLVNGETQALIKEHFPNVPVKDGKEFVGTQGLFDCSKAARLLGWHHKNDWSNVSL